MNREKYLTETTKIFKILFAEHGHKIPDNIRISCGFARGSRKAIGQCFNEKLSKDSTIEIFICPTQSDTNRVCDILAHELIHACYPLAGHKGDFRKCAKDIGLTGKLTATVASEELNTWINSNIKSKLGEYPHQELCDSKKKQSTRLIKVACNSCGYTVRISRKWLSHTNATDCHACHEPLKQG